VDMDAKTWIVEDRGFGGTIINPADIPGGNDTATLSSRDEKAGSGIDGGDGGCACSWET